MSQESNTAAPGGLYLLAVMCLVLGLMGGMGLIMMVSNPPTPQQIAQQEQPPVEPAPEQATPDPPLPAPTPYDLASGGITTVLYLVTGIGLFLRNRWLGYYAGNLTGVLAIVNAFAFSIAQGPGGLTFQIPRMIPPMVLLLLLNLKFSHLFRSAPRSQ